MTQTFDSRSAQNDPAGGASGEQLLQERAERLELVLRATNEGHWDWDLVTGEVYFSPRWKEMLGYRDDEILNDVSEWHSRIHPDDRAAVDLSLSLYTQGFRDTYEIEHRLRHKDGTWRWIETRGTAVRDADGRVVRIVGAHQDVTDRKRVEQEVRRRDAILDAMRFTAERFLSADISWTTGANEVLERLGRATGVSRVYVFENSVDENGELCATNMNQWSAPGVPVSNPTLQTLSYHDMGFERWMDLFRRGEMMHIHVRDMPAEQRAAFEAEGTLSFVIVPIYVNGEWWGFFGLDECIEEREFSAPERDALRAAADTLGAAVARSKAQEASAWFSAIVASSDDAIIGETLDRRIISWNRGAERLCGYTGDEAIGRSIEFLIPEENRAYAAAGFAKVARGEYVPPYESERIRKDGSRVAVMISLSPVRNRDGEIIGAASIARDISGRKRAEEALRRSEESLATLLSNLPGMAYRSVPGKEWRIEFVSEGALELTGYPPSRLVGSRGNSYVDLIDDDDRSALRHDVEAAVYAQRPFHLTYRIRTASGEQKWVMEQGRGVRDASGEITALEGIVMDVTERVEARHLLEQRVAERTRELTTLLEVTASVASTLELQPLLRVILEQFHNVVDYTGAAIFLLEAEDRLRLLDYRGPLTKTELSWLWPLDIAQHSREVIRTRRPVIIDDVRADTPLARAFRGKAIDDLGAVPDNIVSWMGVPLLLRERVVGVLAVDHRDRDAYSGHHAELALAFASQAAVAIENARLFETTQQKAALEERQRLARELHDSVSQALFGIGLGARTARTVIGKDPEKAIAPLDYVLSLAEAGLAEMRALIFELRPEALQEEGIVAALEKQVAALRARYGVEVDVSLDEMSGVSLDVEEALYRIAQEAMHNTVKHARASRVELRLVRESGGIRLTIADDGKGFDASGSFPGHLGLHTMRDRALRLGGSFTLTSAPGEGARIEATIPLAPAIGG
jgi:PAS domain S-box-containing protein